MLHPRSWRFKGWYGEIKNILMLDTSVVGTKTPPDITKTENLDPCRSLNEFILMQYTGLKDKNGKEIYEGDVVKCSSGCPHQVVWQHDFFGMPMWYLSGLNEGYAWTETEEVIGNIYENPELL